MQAMREFKAEAVLMDAMFLGAAHIAQELGVKPLVGAAGRSLLATGI